MQKELPAGFLQAIIEDPTDDGIRLIAADWLEEHGDEVKAELIRVQCELWLNWTARGRKGSEKWPACECSNRGECDGCALRRRERDLLERNWVKWCPEPLVQHTGIVCSNLGFSSDVWPTVAFRRGFISEVHCRLVDWVGEECSECGGTGIYLFRFRDSQARCIQCCGTGRIGAHGPAIVRATPIERVVLTDKQPHYESAPYRHASPWGWATSQAHASPWGLPIELDSDLMGDRDPSDLNSWWRRYRTQPDALDALSAALIAQARRKAGLPALTS